MRRTLVVLTLLCAGLGAWERALAWRAAEGRAARGRVGRLVPEEERAGLPLAALRVERRGSPPSTVARVRGRWRCLEAWLAPADEGAVERVLGALLDARGYVVTEDPEDAADYGIGTPDTLRLSLCGGRVLDDPEGDVLVAFDLGASVPDGGGSFVRRLGSPEVWAIDGDPRAPLAPPRPGLPPLAEPWVVPRSWEGWQAGLAGIRVRSADGPSYALERRVVEVTPEELGRGAVPWRWILAPGPGERPAARLQAHALSLFVQRIPLVELLPPRRRDELVGAPASELVLVPARGDELVLRFGPPLADGRVPVWNDETGTLGVVSAEVAALALPDVELLAEDSERNPWDPYLRER